MSRSKHTTTSTDSFDAFLQPSDVEQIYIVLSLAKQAYGNQLARGVKALQDKPSDFAQHAVAHQDRIAKRHYGIATLFGVIVLGMTYLLYQASVTPGVGWMGLALPAAMACFALWRMERSVHRGRQGNLLLLRLLDALDGQPFSYDAAAFTRFIEQQPDLDNIAQRLAPPEEMTLRCLASLKFQEIEQRVPVVRT